MFLISVVVVTGLLLFIFTDSVELNEVVDMDSRPIKPKASPPPLNPETYLDEELTIDPSLEDEGEEVDLTTTEDIEEEETEQSESTQWNAPDEIARTVFQDERYQRVCATVVETTVICMTLRYPFPVTPRAPGGWNLQGHVDERFFALTGATIVDNEYLDPYRNQTATEKTIQSCLEDVAAELIAQAGMAAADNNAENPFGDEEATRVIAVFTRRKAGESDFQFFGTRTEEQLRRVASFFPNGHKLFIYGDSNVPMGLADCTSKIFAKCKPGPKFLPELNMFCEGPGNERRQLENNDLHRQLGFIPFDRGFDQSKVFLAKIFFQEGKGYKLVEALYDLVSQMTDPTATTLQKTSILVQYSVAHIIRENDLLLTYNQTVEKNELIIQRTVDVLSEESKAVLSKVNFELDRLIVFDGLPQHNPTETGAFDFAQKKCKKADYPVCEQLSYFHLDEHGPLDCRGPIPKNTPYRNFIDLDRATFEKAGLDMKWYGRTWEFGNLFWWSHRSWEGKAGLDCTHWMKGSPGVCIYKYFLQAMIDEYYGF